MTHKRIKLKKKIRNLLLCMCIVLTCLPVSVFAENCEEFTDGSDKNTSTRLVSNKRYAGKSTVATVSVDITWTSMEFTYIDNRWNPDTHSYDEGKWTMGDGTITVENNGTVDIVASFSYDAEIEDIIGSFTKESFTVAAGENGSTTFSVSGKPTESISQAPLGTIKVSIRKPVYVCDATAVEADTLKKNLTEAIQNGETNITILMNEEVDGTELERAVEEALKCGENGTIDLTLKGNSRFLYSSDCFFACNSLKSISSPDIDWIGKTMLNFCEYLESIDLPNLTSIGMDSFSNCPVLKTVNLPKLTSIGRNSFSNFPALTSLILTAEGEITFSKGAFSNIPTENIDLVLNIDKQSQVDGKTWKGYTFKSITFTSE